MVNGEIDLSQPSIAESLFVYGTLTSRFDNGPAKGLRRAADLVGPAVYQGRMYLVSGPRGSLTYPAVVASDDPADRVHGELYRLHDPRVWLRLDEYEGCAANSPLPHEYRRVATEVVLATGEAAPAYVYLFARSIERLTMIQDGDFAARFA